MEKIRGIMKGIALVPVAIIIIIVVTTVLIITSVVILIGLPFRFVSYQQLTKTFGKLNKKVVVFYKPNKKLKRHVGAYKSIHPDTDVVFVPIKNATIENDMQELLRVCRIYPKQFEHTQQGSTMLIVKFGKIPVCSTRHHSTGKYLKFVRTVNRLKDS